MQGHNNAQAHSKQFLHFKVFRKRAIQGEYMCYKLCMTEGHQERKAGVNDIYRYHSPSNQCLIWTKSGKVATL